MNLEAHVQTLETRHTEIEALIEREEHRPHPDTMRLMSLKKRKLRLKEELSRLTHH